VWCNGRVRRYRIGGLAGLGLVALVVLAPGASLRPLELKAPAPTAQLGIVATRSTTSLVRLDPVSLRRTGRALDVKGYAGVWAFAPDRRRVAIGVRLRPGSSQETLRFYTVAGPRRSGRGVPLGGTAAAVAWVRQDRILAYVNDCCPNPNGTASVLAIDPGARRVVARTPVDGSVVQVARTPDSLVLLVAPTNRIGPSRLDVFDADGTRRSAQLDDVVAGLTLPDEKAGAPVGTRLVPGLAIDTTGERAFVVSPAGVVAEVDLGLLVVSYHRWTEQTSPLERLAGWLTPPAEAKGVNGPALTARWLGDGFLAVAGTSETAALEQGNLNVSSHPLGLRIVDVRDWTARMLDAGADTLVLSDSTLLARGSSWDSESHSESGMGLAAYGADRVRRFHVFPGQSVWIGYVYRGRAYVSLSGRTALEIVDLASGRIAGTRRAEAPWPLLDESVALPG
jgi:hypothetical protein